MGCGTFPLSFELGVALPDGAPILGVRMPDLGPIEGTAVATDDAGGKNPIAAIFPAQGFPSGELGLDQIPLLPINNSRVAILNIILRNLALIYLGDLVEEVYGVSLLK